MCVRLIGVDCATKADKVGLATAEYIEKGETLSITAVECAKEWDEIDNRVGEWINNAKNCLLALDSPLGWPQSLKEALAPHEAGARLWKLQNESNLPIEECAKTIEERAKTEADRLFLRETDRWLHRVINKESGNKPFEVGASWIARTANAALYFLERLREKTGHKIPLAWDSKNVAGVWAIEVYPAATLKACGLPDAGLKGKKEAAQDARKDIIKRLKNKIKPKINLKKDAENKMLENEHIFDAVLCVLAAADFINGKAIKPEDAADFIKDDTTLPELVINPALAKKEGWIWVRRPMGETPKKAPPA